MDDPGDLGQNAVRLYRATDFPYEWEEVKELRGRALDTSVWRREGRWWLLTSLREPRGGAITLRLFYAETWPARGPPIRKSDIDGRQEGPGRRLGLPRGPADVRPSQDCSRPMAPASGLNEIIALSTTEYQERPVINVGPGGTQGCATHTYNRTGRFEATDGKFKVTRRLRG